MQRDPRDRRYPERLTGSYLVSLLLHTVLAAMLFAVVSNSSREGASESISGGTVVTIEQRTPVVAQAPAQAVQAAPVPYAPKVAPVQHVRASRPATAPHVPQKHELSKIVPSAPPNPTPLPQASAQPAPVPTQAVLEVTPRNEAEAAIPSPLPSAAVAYVNVKMPPTAAPSPVPTNAPTEKPSAKPVPTAAPTTKAVATPVPATASAAPSAAPVVAKALAQPSSSPAAAVSQASAPPAAKPGAPSPSPTQGAAQISTATGTAPSPGPKGQSSPGPKAGNSSNPKPGGERPISVQPTASPGASSGSAPSTSGGIPDINAKLRALLPHNAVNPSQGSFHPPVTLNGSMEPTPPPDVLAHVVGFSDKIHVAEDALDKIWVTNIRQDGPVTICEGWLVRYPTNPGSQSRAGNGMQISIGGSHPRAGMLAPIVEASASVTCNAKLLTKISPASP